MTAATQQDSPRKVGRPMGSKWSPPEDVARNFATVDETCKLIGCSPRTVYKWIETKQLTSIKYATGARLISRKSISMLIATYTGPGLPAPTTTKKAK